MGIYMDASAVVKQLTTWSPKNSGLLYPFFFATYMVLFDTFLYYVCLPLLVRRTTGPNMSKLWSIGPKSERFTFLSINILQNVSNQCNDNIKLFTK